ncbi:MAG TPA: tetratricopeptide repeat protein [Chthoniobacterales bacterium]|nr:tetratricopeptide repeat protein [Chthoniobacterales bacterium]
MAEIFDSEKGGRHRRGLRSMCAALILLMAGANTRGQGSTSEWQAAVRKYADAKDWAAAMRIVEEEILRHPADTDVRVWRARVLAWSDRLAEAEQEYKLILKVSPKDPDTWLGLASVYLRENRVIEALAALNMAEELDAGRADIHSARGRALRAAGEIPEARVEFRKALALDTTSEEAKEGLKSVRNERKQELRFGQENDSFNFTDSYHQEWISLSSAWTRRWSTSVSGAAYRRGGDDAGKFVISATRRSKKQGALTVGGAAGSNSAVVPGREAFFDLSQSWKTGENTFVRALEFTYGQHWYWYRTARILTVSGRMDLYFPRDWFLSFTARGARSAFSGMAVDWRPSGLARLGFPLVGRAERRLSGNVFFATGTEDFARVDQIGAFAAQTYGAGLRFNLTNWQDVTGYTYYQKRTQDRTDTGFGFSYGFHF